MITVDADDIKNYAPEFASTSEDKIDLFIEYARLFVSETKFDNKAKFGIILMTCHLLTRSNMASSGVAGPITSEKVGELSRNYANNVDAANSELSGTSYGQDFLMLRRTLLISPIVV